MVTSRLLPSDNGEVVMLPWWYLTYRLDFFSIWIWPIFLIQSFFLIFFAEGQIGLSLNIKCSSLHIVSRSKVSFPDEVNSIEVRKL